MFALCYIQYLNSYNIHIKSVKYLSSIVFSETVISTLSALSLLVHNHIFNQVQNSVMYVVLLDKMYI